MTYEFIYEFIYTKNIVKSYLNSCVPRLQMIGPASILRTPAPGSRRHSIPEFGAPTTVLAPTSTPNSESTHFPASPFKQLCRFQAFGAHVRATGSNQKSRGWDNDCRGGRYAAGTTIVRLGQRKG